MARHVREVLGRFWALADLGKGRHGWKVPTLLRPQDANELGLSGILFYFREPTGTPAGAQVLQKIAEPVHFRDRLK
jgi:hypothetical protein